MSNHVHFSDIHFFIGFNTKKVIRDTRWRCDTYWSLIKGFCHELNWSSYHEKQIKNR